MSWNSLIQARSPKEGEPAPYLGVWKDTENLFGIRNVPPWAAEIKN